MKKTSTMKKLKLATVFATAIAASGCAITDGVKLGDSWDTISGTVIKNAGGQIQNMGTEQANKLKCETVDGGIWQQSSTASGGYSTNGSTYKGGAAGRTSGKCLTGTAKTRYLQQILRPEMTAAKATVDAKARENQSVCEMVVTDRTKQRATCGPLGREGRAIGQKISAQLSLESIKEVESKFLDASNDLQDCLADGNKTPVQCVMTYNRAKL